MGQKTPTALGWQQLPDLPADVLRPTYAQSDLSPGIVHIGLGNFHRAHQAWYLHRLMQKGLAQDWAILGAGIRPYDSAMRDKLLAQDCLTTLVELDPAGQSIEVTGAMIGYIPVEEGNGALIRQMADPAIRIVSLTVTEGGYYLDADGVFDTEHPDIASDAAQPDRPHTVFGAMVAALARRRAAGDTPFTALSCDNLQGNGDILRTCLVSLAKLSDPELADWIDAQVAFPNSMVDCIVPATSSDLVEQVAQLGIADAAPVSHENFRQWVIEDRFCNGRPPWEEVGATLTDEVAPYETMKLRILNGGHQLLANAGEILGLATISDCMTDPDLSAFFAKVQEQEILPHLAAVPGHTPTSYLDLIVSRFANPQIRDTTRRVAFDGSSRHPGFVLPSLRDGLAGQAPVSGLILSQALWARMCAGTREDGTAIAPNDPEWARLTEVAQAARQNPEAWLNQSAYYGTLPRKQILDEFAFWVTHLWTNGTRNTLRAFCDGLTGPR